MDVALSLSSVTLPALCQLSVEMVATPQAARSSLVVSAGECPFGWGTPFVSLVAESCRTSSGISHHRYTCSPIAIIDYNLSV